MLLACFDSTQYKDVIHLGALRCAKLRSHAFAFCVCVFVIARGHYVGIHVSGFRDFLLKPQLLRAIVDCGFEHPSEGV